MSKRMYLLASGILLAIAIAPFATAATTGGSILGGKRSPSANRSTAYSSETQIIANTSTYGTRQSNKSGSGGGAIYGCRSGAGGSATGNRPCIRANNLAKGFAFELVTNGTQAGLIAAGNGGDTTKPFTTNATGVATGLNADRVDSKNADDIAKDGATLAATASGAARPFAQVNADGGKGTTRGVNSVSRQGAGDYDVVFAGDVSACAVATSLIGTTPGQITTNPALAADKATTTIDVRTFDAAGATPTDHAFHLSLDC
jgi:hypothetical protein